MPRFTAASSSARPPSRTAILLVQLGTPDAPEPGAVRRYLSEFLSDPRVVEIPAPVWKPILHGVILRRRPAESARKYASVWTPEGSPLMVNTVRQASLLRGWLGHHGHDVDVAFAMRYGNPSIAEVLRELREQGLQRLLVLPLYPQYAASTTATAIDAVMRELAQWRRQPELRTVRSFHDDEGWLDAIVQRIRAEWTHDGPPDRLLMSFHGVPRRTTLAGDPYHEECLASAALLAKRFPGAALFAAHRSPGLEKLMAALRPSVQELRQAYVRLRNGEALAALDGNPEKAELMAWVLEEMGLLALAGGTVTLLAPNPTDPESSPLYQALHEEDAWPTQSLKG